jgi:hypothetical protein
MSGQQFIVECPCGVVIREETAAAHAADAHGLASLADATVAAVRGAIRSDA